MEPVGIRPNPSSRIYNFYNALLRKIMIIICVITKTLHFLLSVIRPPVPPNTCIQVYGRHTHNISSAFVRCQTDVVGLTSDQRRVDVLCLLGLFKQVSH